uniref:Transmembrane p24 trafficking protein 7 n=1 Tax=Seriola dumerili TaxID=41447 RepID=A0A3B4VK52_SERDU
DVGVLGCYAAVLVASCSVGWVAGSDANFRAARHAKQWFSTRTSSIGTKGTLEFQGVVTGGHYDVDCRLETQMEITQYKEMKKQYDSFTFTASRMAPTSSTVYFGASRRDDPSLFPNEEQSHSVCPFHEALKSCIDYTTHFPLPDAQGRSLGRGPQNNACAFWSIGRSLYPSGVSISQVVLLRKLFSRQ